MKIALIGYGTMGKAVAALAEARGHDIVEVVHAAAAGLSAGELAESLRACEVAIDFSAAEAIGRNVEAAVRSGVPIVEGTTGWNDRRELIQKIVADGGGALVFGANFSIGVNLFYRIADYAAEVVAKFPEYEVFIEEQHHSRKKDAPSGTALKLREIISKNYANSFSVSSTRAGNIPGTHRVGFDGLADQILLEHYARTREGFAAGAILAAEWTIGRKGFFEFSDVIDEILRPGAYNDRE